jgi:hypothetical protein
MPKIARLIVVCCVYQIVFYRWPAPASEAKAKEIYYQNPVFAYAVHQVVISRFMEDIALSKTEARNTMPHGQSVG